MPIVGFQKDRVLKFFRLYRNFGSAQIGIIIYENSLRTEVFCQLHIRKPIADDEGILKVICFGKILFKQPYPRFARVGFFVRKGAVN